MGNGDCSPVTYPAPFRIVSRVSWYSDFEIWIAFAPIIGIASWMFDGIFIGATLSREMRNAMFTSVVLYVAALLLLTQVFGNNGLWAALMVLNLARGMTMALLYPRAETAAAG